MLPAKAKIRVALLLALLLALGTLGTAAGLGDAQDQAERARAADPSARRDLHGEALPRGAVVRLGTVCLQHDGEVTSGFFSADGKTLTSAGLDHAVRRWDVATGKELQRSAIPLPKDENYTHRGHRVSPDGKTLATIHTQNADGGPSVTSICLWDLATGKHRFLEGRPNNNRMFRSMTFSPDGASLAVSSDDGDVRLWDVAGGALIRLISTADGSVALAFSPRGDLLALGTSKGTTVRELATGKEVHQYQMAASKAFSPDGKKLASAGSPVRVWDMETGKTLLEVNLDEKVNQGGSFTTPNRPQDVVFSPDSKLLAVNINGSIVLVDAVTGNKVRTVLGDRRAWGKRMFFSPDGRYLALPGQVNFYLYETATGKPLHDAGHQGVVKSVAFAPDGKTLATADQGAVRLWDGATGKELRRWSSVLVRERSSLAFAPDGKSLAHAGGAAIRLWNPATGDELTQFKALQGSGVAFSPDGALLATTTANGPALWDVATGRNVRQLDRENLRTDVAYSPDGKALAGGGDALYLWDAATGKRRHKIEPPSGGERSAIASYSALAFSPDGAHLAAFGGRTGPSDTPTLNLYDVVTGKQVGQFRTTECHRCHMVLAYSPDGKTLASGDTSRDITLWEVSTGKPRAKLAGHRRWMEGLAFSPDGKRLASASADGTALVWDLREAANPAPAESDACWRVLSGDDSAAAYDAIHSLARTPGQALAELRRHLKPVAALEPGRALVNDLDSDNFGTRQRATEELEKLGDQAEAALRKALAGKPSLETRQRIDKLLDLLTTIQVSSPTLLQALRGVEALELMDTAESREFLRVLAGGAPPARLTREAKAALDRLARPDR